MHMHLAGWQKWFAKRVIRRESIVKDNISNWLGIGDFYLYLCGQY